jgi:hypothetical protein
MCYKVGGKGSAFDNFEKMESLHKLGALLTHLKVFSFSVKLHLDGHFVFQKHFYDHRQLFDHRPNGSNKETAQINFWELSQ